MLSQFGFLCNRQFLLLAGAFIGLGLCIWFRKYSAISFVSWEIGIWGKCDHFRFFPVLAFPPTVLNRDKELEGLNKNFTKDKLNTS